jgi:hypothetical protein
MADDQFAVIVLRNHKWTCFWHGNARMQMPRADSISQRGLCRQDFLLTQRYGLVILKAALC